MVKRKAESVSPSSDASKARVYANARRLAVLTADEGRELDRLLEKAGKTHYKRPLGYGTHFVVDRLEFVAEA